MIRLTPRPDAGPIDPSSLGNAEALIQARIDRRISRRQLLHRSAQLGLAVPVVGAMLHATSDLAYGKPSKRGGMSQPRGEYKTPSPVTGPTQPAGAPRQGGKIVCRVDSPLDILHPWLTQTVAGADVLSAITEGLLAYDANQQLQPQLAEAFALSDDGLTYTFTLRQGVSFSDGSPFGAADVIAVWTTIMDPAFPAFSTLGWDRVTGVQGSEDGLTVTFTLSEPYAPFLSDVGTTPICPAGAIAAGLDTFISAYPQRPIGTGPFTIVDGWSNEFVTLAANPSYWGGKPVVDTLVWQVAADGNSDPVADFASGALQIVPLTGSVGTPALETALSLEGVTVFEHTTLSWAHVDLKQIGHLRKRKVRQALDLATPTERIITKYLAGRAAQAVADQPPGSWAYNDALTPRAFDPEEAKACLYEAGLLDNADGTWEGPVPADDAADPNEEPSNGEVQKLELELWTLVGDSQNEAIANEIATEWNAIGITTTVKTADSATLWGPDGYQFTGAMTGCLYSWTNGNDPDDMFYWHSSQIPESPTGSGGNAPAYFFPYSFQAEIDDLTASAAREPDQATRAELYRRIQDLLHEEVPVLFLYWLTAYPVVSNTVGGYWPSPYTRLFWNALSWYLAD